MKLYWFMKMPWFSLTAETIALEISSLKFPYSLENTHWLEHQIDWKSFSSDTEVRFENTALNPSASLVNCELY